MSDFIEAYVKYASSLTDAPKLYHKALAYSLLSCCVGRTRINISPEAKYPNIWLIEVGLSGVTRKTVSKNLALSVLPDHVNILPGDFSPEAFLDMLQNYDEGVIVRDEFSGFLAQCRKDYMASTKELFAILYDCPDNYERTFKSGQVKLENVFFNLISATTPTGFTKYASISDFLTGFLSRFLIVYGEQKERKWRRPLTFEDEIERLKLKDWLTKIYEAFHTNPKPMFEFSEEALEAFNLWETKIDYEITAREDDVYGAIASRYKDYVLKLSALAEVSSMPLNPQLVKLVISNSLKISKNSVLRAIKDVETILTKLTTNLLIILIDTDLEKLYSLLKREEIKLAPPDRWVSHSHLLRMSNFTSKKFHMLIETLVESDRIERKVDINAPRSPIYYRTKQKEEA